MESLTETETNQHQRQRQRQRRTSIRDRDRDRDEPASDAKSRKCVDSTNVGGDKEMRDEEWVGG